MPDDRNIRFGQTGFRPLASDGACAGGGVGMIPKPPENVVVIRDGDALNTFCERMRQRAWLAIDTEFLRERTYYPKLCLVQIADPDEIGLVDVLAFDELDALAGLLDDPDVLKVFHSAEQDLEVLHHTFGHIPAPLFDSQVAAPLAGFVDQMGYARLMAALLGVELAKAHTRTDWTARPLPAGALDYAADDVRYLAVAYQMLHEQLAANGRFDWLREDFAQMAAPGRYDVDPRTAWRRLKNWHRLPPAEQQILAELAEWRETEAMAVDRPRRWILSDDALVALARQQPADQSTLNNVQGLPHKTAARHADALLACIAAGQRRPAEVLAAHGGPPDGPTRRLIKTGMDRLAERAEALGVAASAIASRHEVAALVHGERDGRLLNGWRRELAGADVLAAIEARQQANRNEPSA